MIQSDNGPFVRTMLWSNALSAANGEWGWLQNRGGEWTLTLLSPAAPLKAWVAERNAAFHFSLAFSFENARCFSLSLSLSLPLSPSLSLSLPLSLSLSLKICSILSLIDLEHREATNDICRVTGWEFGARDAGHFPASMLFSDSVTSL